MLLTKVQEYNINEAQSLYLTINTMNTNREFELNMLLRKINIHKIYLGVPDPNLDCYLDNDPFLVFEIKIAPTRKCEPSTSLAILIE